MKIILLIGLMLVTLTALAQDNAKAKNFCGPAMNKDAKLKVMQSVQKNVLDTELQLASKAPITGFFRTGYCATDENDRGMHVIAAKVTDEFLNFSKANGNDLITPRLSSGFPGLKAGNTWCLCAMRWKEALDAGVAPPVILEATNIKALEFVTIETLKSKQAP
jgi:uncharacterized protein